MIPESRLRFIGGRLRERPGRMFLQAVSALLQGYDPTPPQVKNPTRERRGLPTSGPAWEPLENLVGYDGAHPFMAMSGGRTDEGDPVFAYKHMDTRRYIHLTEDGRAWKYVETADGYGAVRFVQITTAEALAYAMPED